MVFTGLVQAVGRAVFDTTTNMLGVRVEGGIKFWSDCASGDSIAINGCCLTILASTKTDTATFFVMEESRGKTNLVKLATTTDGSLIGEFLRDPEKSTPVNLEKALKVGDPIGGHTVSGHIDGGTPIVEITPHEDGSRSFWIDLSGFDSNVAVVVTKGSITLDGVALTVAEIKDTKMRVSLIPYTLSHTRLQFAKAGDVVNVEFDQTLKLYKAACINWKGLGERALVEQLPGDLKQAKDEGLMKKAIDLGEFGRPTSAPNPWVGCVITNSYGDVIGEGFHKKAGQNHAEVNAIQDAIARGHGDQLEGATCYTTLEPCSHYGRTGPCDQFLIKHKIARVVIAVIDPDKLVSGTGIQHLLNAGVHVTTGVLESKARESLRPYLHHRSTGIPWVVFKVAASLDGKIAAPDKTSKWITGEQARTDAHQRFRATSQAIIVGSKTAEEDNPSLTVRSLPEGSDATVLTQPIRVVVGSKPFQLGGNLLDTATAPTIVFTTKDATVPAEWEEKGIQVIRVGDNGGHANFKDVLVELGKSGVLQVLVEGGAQFGSSVLQNGHVNQLVIYQAPIILGQNAWPWSLVESSETLPSERHWKLCKIFRLGEDVCVEYEFRGSKLD